jgi:2-aminoadipate transaminase
MSTLDLAAIFSKSAPDSRAYYGDSQRPKYDFAIAYPDPRSVPALGLAEALCSGVESEGKDLALYPGIQGYRPLRQFIADKLARDQGIRTSADDILLTSGAGQGIHISMEMLLDPGDVVLTDDFTYSGGLAQMRRFRGDPRGVPTDAQGMLPDALEAKIQQLLSEGRRIKLIYLVPSFQNPQGWTISLERRKAILELAYRYGLLILEDDCYADLRYEGTPVPPLYALDEGGHVIYLSSFSKTIAPGVRCGFMTASRPLLEKAMASKSGGPAPLFVTLAIHRFASSLVSHIEQINDIQMHKRDAMLEGLATHFGDRASWLHPEGGLSVWVKMKGDVDMAAIREQVQAEENVGYNPGINFSPERNAGKNFFRLSFGFNSAEEIRQGMERLAVALRRHGVL